MQTHDDGRGGALTIDERDPELLRLLYVAYAWGLDPVALPTLDPLPAVGASALPDAIDRDEAVERWLDIWRSFHAPGIGGRWQDAHGDDGIDVDALRAWRDALIPGPLPPLERSPERLAGDALRDARELGLERVLVLPSNVDWAEPRSGGVLLVTRGTRHDPQQYAAALAAYGTSA
jgi:hypothetical protein